MSAQDWVVRFESSVNNMEDNYKELERKKKRCIHKVPDYIRELDNNAFKPQVVSLGPFYHGNPNLRPMEDHKLRACMEFQRRTNVPMNHYLHALAQAVEDLKDAYDDLLIPLWVNEDVKEFVQMMVRDGLFILEILRTVDNSVNVSIFSGHGYLDEMPLIRQDMLLLENQVPLLVLEILVAVERGGHMREGEYEVINSIRRFFGLGRRSEYKDKSCLHILDVCRRGLVVEPLKHISQFRPFDDNLQTRISLTVTGEFRIDIPSAAELHEAGIRFKTSKTTNLNDIQFKGSTLRLPPIMVTDDTKSFFLNLMAFERVHVGAGNEVTSYVFFMGCLIKSDRDVGLLRSLGFVPGALGSNEDIAQLYRSIFKKAMLHHDHRLVEVLVSVNKYLSNRVRTKLSAWRMDLLQNYLKSPWGVMSVIAAIIIFTLTTIQTVYAVLSYIHRKDK